ncbi:MAG: sulfite exporter TauE/SafE family protein [Woeseiaceae bacterium]|nr:sulfite exporter TauE/SafE family protein [Woeseiaceae bacterium]
MDESQILILTAASIAFLHTILGPDHYLVFVAMGKARNWTLARTLRVTFGCGLGHVLSSVVIGAVGIWLGAELTRLVAIETGRGTLAGWALLAFGLVYTVWGLRHAYRNRRHSHLHAHGDIVHSHEHDHHGEHAHVHLEHSRSGITPWAIFIIFVLGPCEALIPLFMYPAAQQNAGLVIAVAVVFGVVTLATMLAAVTLGTLGLKQLKLPRLERYAHAIAGASIVACGSAINFAGL